MTFERGESFAKGRNKKFKAHRKSSKKAKIIVRNLPFKNLTEKTLEDLFMEYGDVQEVRLLRKPDGKLKGCGFVQFEKVSSAARAISLANQKEINGRKIIIDWALPKDTYMEKVKKFQQEYSVKEEVNDSCNKTIDKEIKVYIDKKPGTWGSESESDTGEDDEEISSQASDNVNKEEEVHEESPDENKYDTKHDNRNQVKPIYDGKTDKSSDAEDGKTVFIRNVPFSATNSQLKQCVESYGPVEYALICIDKLTEHSKGTAFVKFKSEESARQCVKDSNKLSIFEIPLNVTFALTKEHLESRKTNKKTGKDSRNLYLVREGVVPAGSKAAAGVSASDMAKRLQLEQWKSQILKNLNMFVSRTRLVVHNLPPHYDDTKLRQMFVKHGNPDATIREAKVMWEKNKVDAKGKHVSKEVGFVSFTQHEDALAALRNINNNPSIFTPGKRPIVAFSVENRAVINQKLKRIEKSRAKLGVVIDEKMAKFNRKQRRFIRRRQKIIDQRREAKKLKRERDMTDSNSSGNAAVTTAGKSKPKAESTAAAEEKLRPRKRERLEGKASTSGAEVEFKCFTGVTSEPGSKVKLRSRFNLKKQAILHSQTLKKEKAKRKMKKVKRNLEPIRQPNQKKGKGKLLLDDLKLSRLISKHREDIRNSSAVKKWYES